MSEELVVLSLFSGIGAPEVALKNLGIPYKIYGFSEIDKYAIKSYCAIHDTDPNLNLGDITEIDIASLPTEGIDLIFHGSPCFTKDTLVLSTKGYKNIVDVKIGDLVLDHTNSYNKVTDFLPQGKKEIWKIKGMAFDEIKTTENHKFLTREKYREWNKSRTSYDRKFKKPIWKECKYLTKNDYLGVAINQNNTLPEWNGVECTRGNSTYVKNNLDFTNNRFWYLCGRFLGDGWTINRKARNNNLSGIIICCGKHETQDIENKFGDLFHYTKIEDSTTYKYQFSNKELSTFLSQFEKGASNKIVPGFVIDLPIDLLKSFLDGYFDSDGSFKDGRFKATSTSRSLVYGIGQCIAKVYKRPYAIYKSIRPRTHVISGRTVNQKDTYTVSFKLYANKQDKAFFEDEYIWFPIGRVERTNFFEDTYDITVENNHSFTANGCIVHNCQDFSVAGKGQGAEAGSGTRSSLMWNTVEIVSQCKPKYVIWENVKNVLSKKHIHNFDKYMQSMRDLGYKNKFEILNAKNYGVPQHRERVFVVSILEELNQDFQFPIGKALDLRLKDILEENIPDSFYISEEKVQVLMKNIKGNVNLNKAVIGTCHKNNDLGRCCREKVYSPEQSAPTLTATMYKDPTKVLQLPCIGASRGRNPNNPGDRTPGDPNLEQRLEINLNGTSNTISTVQKDNYVVEAKRIGGLFDDEKGKHQAGSVWDKDGISPTLDTMQGGYRQPCVLEDSK